MLCLFGWKDELLGRLHLGPIHGDRTWHTQTAIFSEACLQLRSLALIILNTSLGIYLEGRLAIKGLSLLTSPALKYSDYIYLDYTFSAISNF
ncbi:hypothetical protein N9I33_02340 [Paracoccaceae bacterium]|nr:hypothetical protein [Paracoccaceae bacterium]